MAANTNQESPKTINHKTRIPQSPHYRFFLFFSFSKDEKEGAVVIDLPK